MQVSHGSKIPWEETTMRHRSGGIAFKHLLVGEEGTARNFGLDLARQTDFHSPMHKHNFEQIRYAVQGSVNLGPGLLLRPGMVAYHGEGTPYGPQDDDPSEERIVLVLQFGGASGQGYLSLRQTKTAQDELQREGKFEGGRFHSEKDGKSINGFQALWEHANESKLVYPMARYPQPILMDPKNFTWVPVKPGIQKKTLGVFTERQVPVEQLHVEQDRRLERIGGDGIHILFVIEGGGRIGEERIAKHAAILLTDGHAADVEASDGSLVLQHYSLPNIE